MTLQVGTVFKWDHFPFPRYGGETKARWFIYLGETGQFSQIAGCYLCTTTTQMDQFKTGGSRAGHSYFKFEVRQFPLFERDCILDFDDPPQPIEKTRLLNKDEDIIIKGRLKKPEEITDDDILGIIRGLVKSEKTVLELTKKDTSGYLEILATYLPQMAGREEIEAWIKENIDFSQYKNSIQAMGTVMKHFGKLADGNLVKEIIGEIDLVK